MSSTSNAPTVELLPIETLFLSATENVSQGRLDLAELACHEIFQLAPEHALGFFLNGVILDSRGDLQNAVASLHRATEADPQNWACHHYLGIVFRRMGEERLAEQCLRRACELNPSEAEALIHLGQTLLALGKFALAKDAFSKALRQKPNQPVAFEGLANTYLSLGNRRAAAHFFRAALKQDPRRPTTLNNYGNLLAQEGKNRQAEESYQAALESDADYAECHFNLGNLYARTDRTDEAIAHFRRAVALNAGLTQAWDNLGNVLNDNGEPEDALLCWEQVLRDRPGWAQAEWNRSLALLKLGRMREGWRAYEARLKMASLIPPREFSAPRWDGREFRGQCLLVTTEQGLGDAIQFLRYTPFVKALGGDVVVECQQGLARLFQTASGVDRVVARGESLPAYHWHVSIMSLPAVLEGRVEAIPNQVPYLWPPPCNHLLGIRDQLRVGLCWAGNPVHRNDRLRSCRFADCLPLLDIDGVRWINLQKNVPQHDVAALGSVLEMTHLPGSDLYEAAQIVAQLDLVVTVDTSIAHLAGALNIPVWILLAKVNDWRWGLEGNDSHWYPSARLFRQSQLGDWREVMARVCQELRGLRSLQSTRNCDSSPEEQDR